MTGSDKAPVVAPFRGYTCRELYNAIFEAEAPEQVVRQLPSQSLFMIVKQRGLASSSDLISMASLEQCRVLSDFDLWHGDVLNEEVLWEWLALTDETDSLELLQKVVKFIDLKVIAILIGKYVQVKVLEEPTDQSPGPGFHTPDKGYTWIGITMENPDHHFLLARLLALIFETNTELFYQLLSTSSVATLTMLEEESYQDRVKRLAAEGVPEPEISAQAHAPYALTDALHDLRENKPRKTIEDVRSVEPLLYEARSTRLFAELMRRVTDHEEVEMEFTYLINAAVVRYGIDFSDQEQLLALCEKVKGAINIALEKLVKDSDRTVLDVYQALGLGKLYRLGLTEITSLRSSARKVSLEVAEKFKDSDRVLFATLACAREAFPSMPAFLEDDGSVVATDGSLESGDRAIETLKAISTIRSMLDMIHQRQAPSA